MDRVFDEFMPARFRGEEVELTFPVDVYETEKEVVVKAALPGMKPEEIDVSVSDNAITIKGEARHEEKVERENYYRQEIRYGAFCRIVPLPAPVRAEEADAEYKDGVLTIRLPKTEEVRPKSIKVRAKQPAATE